MVDSDSDTETVNESCWKWKLLRFTSNHRSNFQQLISQGDSSVESVVLESPSSNLEIQNSTQDHLHSNHHHHHHNNSHISLGVVSPGSIERSPSDKLLRVRPRSVGDISESLRGGPGTGSGSGRAEVVILHGSVSPTDSHPIINQSHVQSQSTTTTTTSNSSSNQNHHGNNGGSNNNGSSGGGGILSFFGVRFNKSGTRHLDRSSGDRDRQTIQSDSGLSDKPGKTLDRDHRYTKFPLTSSPSQSVQNNSNNSNPPVPSNQQHNNHPHHHNIPTSRSNPTISIIQSVPLQTDSPFDATHIKLTPQTITYAHPHKSPVPPVKGIIHGANSHKFLSNAVSSLGRRSNKDKDKEKDGVNAQQQQQQQPPNSNNKGNKQLKAKSKSDNSLHRVTLNNNNSGSSSGSGSSSHNSGNNSGSGGNSSNNSNSRNINNVLSPHFYPQGEQRLNSVQLGDHATIRLPWTGFQRQHLNNLSTVTPARPTPNTHNNNFTAFTDTNPNNTNPLDGTVRYVECGLWSGSASQSQQTHSFLPTSSSSGLLGSVSASSRDREPAAGPPRRRARSLERSSNFRIFPIGGTAGSHLAVSPTKGPQTGGPKFSTKDKDNQKVHKSKPTKQLQAKSNSLERPSRHRIRQSLSPSEQEILLRNITFSRVSDQIGLFVDVPPALPKKKSKNSSSSKAPPLGKLHRSAPNSSFSSVESSSSSSSCGDCGNSNSFGPINKAFKTNNHTAPGFPSSCPPSPPPRPPSTLKPESRLGASERVSSPTTTSSNSSSPSSQQHPPPPPLPTIKSSEVTRIRESQSSPNPKQSNNCRTLLSSGSNSSCNSNNSATMNSNSANRRPVVPRSVPHPGDSGGSSSLRDPRSRLSPTNHSQSQGQEQSQTGSSASSTISTPSGMSLEDARNSGFINKPSKGWLHSDQLLSKEGVTYTVRYIGCLDVNTSMKSLDFDTRSLIAKECINHVCEAAGLKSVDKKRKTDRRVVRILGLRPRLDQAGSDVHLTITSTCLKLTSLDTGSVIATHDLPNISFASGGDVTMLDFVAYVAKDAVVGRACFVLECGSGRAQDVITTVGQAFELRFKEYLQKRPAPPLRVTTEDPDREYYNDLPGKSPPESALAVAAAGTAVGGTSSGSAFRTVAGQDGKNQKGAGTGTRARTTPNLTLPTSSSPYDNKDGMSVNLIDFEAPTPPAFGPSTQDRNLEALLLSGGGLVPTSPTKTKSSASANGLVSPGHSSKDPFNMQPFGSSIPMTSSTGPVSAAEQKAQLEGENWFHGIISRGEAEALVRNDGDFLVRESQATPGQYVLTGLQNGSSKHLLLVDPEGVVRTKDREFDSVIHLIRYHSDNSLPIISAESMVLLRHPVPRSTQGQVIS